MRVLQKLLSTFLNVCPRIPLPRPTGLRSKPLGKADRSGGGQAGGLVSRVFRGLVRLFFRPLRIDISTHRFEACSADASDVVRTVPEQRLLVERGKVFAKAIPCTTSAGRLEIVDQNRDIERRMGVHKQVDVIGLAAKLDQRASPRFKRFGKRAFEVIKQFGCENLAPILRHKNNVQLNAINSVRA